MAELVETAPGAAIGARSGAGARRRGAPPWSSSGSIVLRRTARKAARSGVVWGYVFGLTLASSALTYTSAYKTAAQRAHVAALFGSNAGLAALVGPARQLQTVPGYTAWKSLMFLIVVGGVWGLLTSTRLMRGEEDAGRWELLLAGQTTRRRATAQALAGLGTGLAGLFAVTAAVTIVVGRSSSVHIGAGAALFVALATACPAAVFMATGALTSQLVATRRQAAGYAAAALGVFYALRLVADAGADLSWLRWASPLGWVEELQPLTSPQPLALLPLVGLVIVLTAAAIYLAGRRDVGSSVLPERASTRPRTALLGGTTGLTWRLTGPVVAVWVVSVAAYSLLLGSVAKQGGSLFTTSTSIEHVVHRLGATGASAGSFLGVVLLMVAWLVAVAAAGQVTAARGEEACGRLENLVVRPVGRASWMIGRLLSASAVAVILGLAAGVSTWLGALSQGAGVSLGSLLEAGLALVPPALCLLGIGFLVMAVWPRATAAITYGLLVWSLFLELVGGFVGSGRWLLDTSLFHHMKAAPAVSPDWLSAGVLVAIGAAAAAVGVLTFRRRDLVGA